MYLYNTGPHLMKLRLHSPIGEAYYESWEDLDGNSIFSPECLNRLVPTLGDSPLHIPKPHHTRI